MSSESQTECLKTCRLSLVTIQNACQMPPATNNSVLISYTVINLHFYILTCCRSWAFLVIRVSI